MKDNCVFGVFSNHNFSKMWSASLVSNIGSWMHSVGALWLMSKLSDSTLMVALVQTVSTIPVFLFALPAGVIADAYNKKHLLLLTNSLMLLTAVIFAFLVLTGKVNPTMVLFFTFLLGLGTAFMGPSWQATVPEIVSKEHLQQAIILGGININLSRSIGPALAGFLISQINIASPFFLNALSFLLIVMALLFWDYQPPQNNSNLQAERIFPAIRTGLRYAAHSKPLKDTMLHIGGFIFCTNAFWVLLPLVVKNILSAQADFFGLLMTAIGLGAILGAFLLTSLKKKLDANKIVLLGTSLTSLATLSLSLAKVQFLTLIISLIFGVGWTFVLSSINISAQVALPNWVRGRGLAIFLMVFFGSISAGATFWGWFCEKSSISLTLIFSSLSAIIFAFWVYRFKLQRGAELNLNPSLHWSVPITQEKVMPEGGAVLITIKYKIIDADREQFLKAIYKLAESRKRDGAYQWGIYEEIEEKCSFIEHFLEDSWNTHLHHHQRVTESDKLLQEQVNCFHQGKEKPEVRHYLAPSKSSLKRLLF